MDEASIDMSNTTFPYREAVESLLFYRPDQRSLTNSYVDDISCLLVSSFPSLFYTMPSHRDIFIYEMLRNDYTVPTRYRHRRGMIDPLGCKACRAIR
jgi:hypothetical protein